MNTLAKLAAVGLVSLAAIQFAHAGGFLADTLIKPIFGDHAAREADKEHEKLGKPLDLVVPIIVGGAINGEAGGAPPAAPTTPAPQK